jgi:hypothetical protein
MSDYVKVPKDKNGKLMLLRIMEGLNLSISHFEYPG